MMMISSFFFFAFAASSSGVNSGLAAAPSSFFSAFDIGPLGVSTSKVVPDFHSPYFGCAFSSHRAVQQGLASKGYAITVSNTRGLGIMWIHLSFVDSLAKQPIVPSCF